MIDQVIGNYLDPRLQGRTLNISSLVVLVSVILWGWIWGVVGTLLAVPMTVADHQRLRARAGAAADRDPAAGRRGRGGRAGLRR